MEYFLIILSFVIGMVYKNQNPSKLEIGFDFCIGLRMQLTHQGEERPMKCQVAL